MPKAACWPAPTRSEREAFLAYVAEHRAPRIAAHWEFMLEPLVPDHSEREGALRYRQIEYYRMPMMAYLAVDEPRALTRSDFIRLGLVTGAGDDNLPFGEQHLADFEQRHCYDRFWSDSGAAPRTRYLCCGHALVVVGDARAEFYRCRERGVLAQFRHQHFMLFLIAHVQKAALLMFSDRLVDALKRLDIADPESVKQLQARDPQRLRDLSALHAPLLVPRGVGAGAGARAVPACAPRSSASIRCMPRSRSACTT